MFSTSLRQLEAETVVSRLERTVQALQATMEDDNRRVFELDQVVKDNSRQLAAVRAEIAGLHRAVEDKAAGLGPVLSTIAAVSQHCRTLDVTVEALQGRVAGMAEASTRQREEAQVKAREGWGEVR
jgi:chromosome segregation ATPase